MGLFNRKKEIWKHEMLERVKIDPSELLQSFTDNKVSVIGNANGYTFYRYHDHILRQTVKKPKDIVFFGKAREHVCLFQDSIFLASGLAESGRDGIGCINIETGNTTVYQWRCKENFFIILGGYGRYYCSDAVEGMTVVDDKMLIEMKHTDKGAGLDTPVEWNRKIIIEVTREGDKYIAKRKELP